jgi:hypothetical protein
MERWTERYDRRHRRRMRWALLASVLFHVLVLLFFREARPLPESPFAAAGPRAGDDRAAAGGGMEVVALNVVQPQVEQPPVVVPVPVPGSVVL